MPPRKSLLTSNQKKVASSGPAGIKEIAAALGTSIGTVDRALHSRPGINPITRSRVLQMAESMGYRPNLAARHLKSQKQIRIAVHLPAEISFFFDAVREGIAEAAAPFGSALRIDPATYPRLGEGDAELFEQALRDGPAGMVICPGLPAAMKPLIRRAARKNIPVVCVATDATGTERLTAVLACPLTSGAIASELLSRTTHAAGPFAVVTGSLQTEDHGDKVEGFRESLRQLGDTREIATIIEMHDDPQAAYAQTNELLRKRRDLCGLYVTTANSLPVIEAIAHNGRADKITVVTTDLFPALLPLIRSGRVLATIYQRPQTQGRLAFQSLYQFLLERKYPAATIKVAPHIVMRSNLDLFADRISGDQDQDSHE